MKFLWLHSFVHVAHDQSLKGLILLFLFLSILYSLKEFLNSSRAVENANAVLQRGQTGRFVMWFVWLSVSPLAFADLLHTSCSWNRWRCSWRRSTKTSRKCCAREESWSAKCWTSRTRFFLCSVFLPYNPWAQAYIHTCMLLKCVPLTDDWRLLFSAHMCHRSWKRSNEAGVSFRLARGMWRLRRGWRKIWRGPKSFWRTLRLCWTTWRATLRARGRLPNSKIKCAILLNAFLCLSSS